ncbi:MAG: ribonuclease HII [Candidatus Komeilibacteria bacterium]
MKLIIGCDEAPHRSARAGAKRRKPVAKQDGFIKQRILIGVDEAGRGAWAGPLVAAAVCLKNEKKFKHPLIKDSKKLSPQQRQEVFIYLQPICKIGIGVVEVGEINEWGLQKANVVAVERALIEVRRKKKGVGEILIDHIGGFKNYTTLKENYSLHKFGESKYQEIAAASIVAKVSRDQMMCKLHKKFPHYGFAEHKGYGTQQHLTALKKYGVTPLHRLKFQPIIRLRELVE